MTITMGRLGAWLAIAGGAAWTGLALLNMIITGNSPALIPLKVIGLLGIALAITIAGDAIKPSLDYWQSWGLGAGLGIAFALLWGLYAVLVTNVSKPDMESTTLQIFLAYAVPGIPAVLIGVLGLSHGRGVQALVPKLR